MTAIAESSVEDWRRLYDANLFSALALVGGQSLNICTWTWTFLTVQWVGQSSDSPLAGVQRTHCSRFLWGCSTCLPIVGRVWKLQGSPHISGTAYCGRGARYLVCRRE